MLIGIDAHAIGSQLTGNETYIKNLIPALARSDPDTHFVLFFTREQTAREWRDRFRNVRVHVLRPATPYLRIPISLPISAHRLRLDLLHVQYIAPPFCPMPFVTTIHDISFEHFPRFFTKHERVMFRWLIRDSARRARSVLTVSEYSRQDLMRSYGLGPERLVLTPNGVAENFRPIPASPERDKRLRRYGIDSGYLLSVGALQPRKNLSRLIGAYLRFRERDEEQACKLVVVGKKGWLYKDIFRSARHSRFVDDIIFTGYVADDDLPAIYSAASAFVYPSIFEGFGLPVLEAMACGVPVATSNCSSLPEVAGDAALSFDPLDEDAMTQSISRLVRDEALRERLRKSGLERAKKYSWDETARLTLNAYRAALGRLGGVS